MPGKPIEIVENPGDAEQMWRVRTALLRQQVPIWKFRQYGRPVHSRRKPRLSYRGREIPFRCGFR